MNKVTASAHHAPWRWRRLLTAPHRIGFATGAAAMSTLALWWLAVLLAARLGLAMPWAVPPVLAHGLLFTLAFMPAFMAGFLFTAGPRWLGLPAIDAGTLVATLLQLVGGWTLGLLGVHANARMAALGAAWAGAAWLRLSWRFGTLVGHSRVPDRWHPKALLMANVIGGVAMALASMALLSGQARLLQVALHLALWAFVAPVFALVSHRMVPILGAAGLSALEERRPHVLLLPMLGGLGLAGLAEVAALPPAWLAPPLALAAIALLALAWRWQRLQGRRGASQRLVAMLRGGFVWLGVTLALQATSVGLRALHRPDLGAAPLHALTLGYLGSTWMAMATRVAAAHSGRPLAVDRWTWAAYGALQLAVLLRIAASLGLDSLLPAAALWAAVALYWTRRCGGWLGRPRVDDRPG